MVTIPLFKRETEKNEDMMKRIYKLLMMAVVVTTMTGCDELMALVGGQATDYFEEGDSASIVQEKLKVTDIRFSEDFKDFVLSLTVLNDIGPYTFSDTTRTKILVTETVNGIEKSHRGKPIFVKSENTEADEVDKLGLKVLALIDLTLSQRKIDEQKAAVEEMRYVFNHNNLLLAFMSGKNVSPTVVATDYIMQNSFKHQPENYVCLYRSIVEKLHEIEQRSDLWANTREAAMVIFSDGDLYDDNDEPFDPNHFEYEELLLRGNYMTSDSLTISFVNMKSAEDRDNNANDASTNFKVLCANHHGLYQTHFGFRPLVRNMMVPIHGDLIANKLYFTNPDYKIFAGTLNRLQVGFYSIEKDSIVASVSTYLSIGSFFRPIIVNGLPTHVIIAAGWALAIFFGMLVWLVFQFLEPYIRYLFFRRKYVVRYQKGMSLGNIMVRESCYFCKAPFETGEEVVVKCSHTMHKSCWDENDYHCPEYGRHCEHGSHYYNSEHVFDSHNALYYQRWILMAILMGTCAWSLFIAGSYFFRADSVVMPFFGFSIAFFLTLGLSLLTVRRRKWSLRLADILVRALAAAVLSSILFLLTGYVEESFHIYFQSYVLNWIPWTLSGFLVMFFTTVRTGVKIRKRWFLIILILSLVSMYIWSVLFIEAGLDFRVLLLFSFFIFAIGIAVCIAHKKTSSERYFLKVIGPIKEMDIALYKWFRANPNDVVTIGRSIDCSLQMSWDMDIHIPAEAAQVTMEYDMPRLTVLDEGVTVEGKPATIGSRYQLYHNTRFSIGQSTFIYYEKDL